MSSAATRAVVAVSAIRRKSLLWRRLEARTGVLEGRIEPGRVFDRTVGLAEVPDGYRAMNERRSIKVMVEP